MFLARRLAALVAATAAVLVTTSAAGAQPGPDHTGSANQAFADVAATRQVIDQARDALVQVLTYSSTDPQRWQQAVRAHTTSAAQAQLTQLFGPVLRNAAAGYSVTASIDQVGVVDLRGDRAQLLVFLVQRYRLGRQAPQITGAAVTLQVQRTGGRWLISDIQSPR